MHLLTRRARIKASVAFAAAALALGAFPPLSARAQIRIGTVRGTVADAAGALLASAAVSLDNALTGERREAVADGRGEFAFNNTPFDQYTLRVSAPGFLPEARVVNVRSNIPVTLSVRLRVVGVSESLTVAPSDGLIEKDSAGTEARINRAHIGRMPGAVSGRHLQKIIATTAGWTTQSNGLLHIRGVEDGILYVLGRSPPLPIKSSIYSRRPGRLFCFGGKLEGTRARRGRGRVNRRLLRCGRGVDVVVRHPRVGVA